MRLQKFKTMVLGALTLIMIVAFAGCSSISVSHDYDNHFAWRSFKTYAWLGTAQTDPNSQASAQLSGGLLDKRIHDAVDFEMGQRNIVAGDNPEILVKYHLGAEDKVSVTDWGYRYSDYYWGYGGRQIDVYQYTEGTLVIDVIDAESKTLIWRGSATGTVDGKQRTPEEMQERVNGIVGKTLESFPPK